MPRHDAIITIDGPSGSGKSTLSRQVARAVGYTYLDTGAMYRAVGVKVARAGMEVKESPDLESLLQTTEIRLLPGEDDARVFLDDEDVSLLVRTPEMAMMASRVSALPMVRDRLTELQRQIGAEGKIVAEGRDMGTVVFPRARHKFFLDAGAEVRARRRTAQLKEKGLAANYDEILAQIEKRDADDQNRAVAPLRPAADAVIIDTSCLSIDEVLRAMLARIEAHQGGAS